MPYDPYDTNASRDIPINTPTPVGGQVVLVPYDDAWPTIFESEAAHVRAALGDKALMVEHIGSTAVPGLEAKPCVDILVAVENSADEAAYVPDLDAAGFVLRGRHPEWHEHRVFKSKRINVNLHVWSEDSSEIARHLDFRDWLRENEDDRNLYAEGKRRAAAGNHETIDDYNDAKNDVIQQIQNRMRQSTNS